jgi:hypothetical protein
MHLKHKVNSITTCLNSVDIEILFRIPEARETVKLTAPSVITIPETGRWRRVIARNIEKIKYYRMKSP